MPNASHILERSLVPTHMRHLRLAAEVCAGRGVALFLVGGSVRDLLLEQHPTDLDLSVVNGDDRLAPALAQALHGEMGARSQFGTAKLTAGDTRIDLALARTENYARPGALPTVAPGSIHDDLARRDFSANAVAISLAPDSWGDLIDPHSGREDIQRGLIRVLHPGSFADDATRILRAVRYARRLGFSLESETEELLRRDLSYLDTIKGDRVRHEVARIFREEGAASMMGMAQELGVLSAIYPPLRLEEDVLTRLGQVGAEPSSETDLLFLSALAYPLPPEARPGLMDRLNMDTRWARVTRDAGAIRDSLDELSVEDLPASRLYSLVSGFDLAAVRGCALATDDPRVAQRLQLYDAELRHQTPTLKGDHLIALGVPEGPRVGQLLDALRAARLDGLLSTREDEVQFVTTRLEAES